MIKSLLKNSDVYRQSLRALLRRPVLKQMTQQLSSRVLINITDIVFEIHMHLEQEIKDDA